MADTSRSVYTVHKRLDVLEANVNEALALATSAQKTADAKQTAGRDGAPGAPGQSIIGPAGSPGPSGKDAAGLSGAIGPQGIPGAAGRDGKDSPLAVEYDSLLFEVRKLITEMRTSLAAQDQKIQLLSDVIEGAGQKTQDYMAFLIQRNQARRASGNVQK
jgi:hypothetical protein